MYSITAIRAPLSAILSISALAFVSFSFTNFQTAQAAESCPCFSASTIIQSCKYIKDMGDPWLMHMNKDSEYGFTDFSCWESRSTMGTKGWTYSTEIKKYKRCQTHNVGSPREPYKTVSEKQHNSCFEEMSAAAKSFGAIVQGQ